MKAKIIRYEKLIDELENDVAIAETVNGQTTWL